MANRRPTDMTRAQIMVRAETKRVMVLEFLASGERWATIEIIAMLLTCSRPRALATVKALESAGCLRSEKLPACPTLYGITAHGLSLAGEMDLPPFAPNSTNPLFIPHHLDTQRARLRAEASGWSSWIPGKRLHAKPGMFAQAADARKVPDALVTQPSGRKVAVEIERTHKTRKRYAEIIAAHLRAIRRGEYDVVHYLSPGGHQAALQAVFSSIQNIKVQGQTTSLDEKHRSRFRFYALADWPPQPKARPVS